MCMDALMNEVKIGIGRRGENGDCWAFCMQITWFFLWWVKRLRVMVGQFVKVCRRGLKVYVGKSKEWCEWRRGIGM